MKKKSLLKLAAIAMAAVLTLCSCAKSASEPESKPSESSVKTENIEVVYPDSVGFDDYETAMEIRENYPVAEEFITALNDFSYSTAASLLTGEKNQNYSPVSLYYALSVAATGASGKTADEIFELLGMEDSETLSEQCSNFYRNVYFDNEIGKLRIANSVWVMDGYNITENFGKNAAENLFASVYHVDFGTTEGMQQISDWISENTMGTLSPAKEPNPEQLFSIINTVYFYDEWTNIFSTDATKEDDFTLADGTIVQCDFMTRTASSGFRKGEGFTAAILGLKNSEGMMFILPDEGVSVSELIADSDKISEILNGGEESYGEVHWEIPKFSFGSSFELKECLEGLGMEAAFSSLNADFSGMTSEEIYISEAIQQTHIGIDENGVEASAYTELMYAGEGMPEDRAEMVLDRPFIYAIMDGGSWLFIGVCADPTAE